MDALLIAFETACLGGILFGCFILFRNSWVYRQRSRVLNGGPNVFIELRRYDMLPDYHVMLWRLWVWDVLQFVAPEDRAEFIALANQEDEL